MAAPSDLDVEFCAHLSALVTQMCNRFPEKEKFRDIAGKLAFLETMPVLKGTARTKWREVSTPHLNVIMTGTQADLLDLCRNNDDATFKAEFESLGIEAIKTFADTGNKPEPTPGKNFFDTGVTLVTDKPVEGVPSIDTKEGLDKCWG